MAEQPSARHWLTPRFPLEMAVASAGTLALVLVFGGMGREPAEGPMVALKTAAKPPDPPAPAIDSGARTDEFIERFALAHVNPPLPESALADPDPAKASPPRAAQAAPARDRAKPAPAVAAAKPTPRPQDVALVEPPAAPKPPEPAKKEGFHIPVVSDLFAKLPTGGDIVNGVGAAGRKVASLFGG